MLKEAIKYITFFSDHVKDKNVIESYMARGVCHDPLSKTKLNMLIAILFRK